MAQQSRQARRARTRRQQQQATRARTSASPNWGFFAGIAVVAAAVAVFLFAVLHPGQGTSSGSPTPSANSQGGAPTIAGIQCNYNEMVGAGFYHVHAHVTILNHGKPMTIPQYVGYSYSGDCLYWTHTHDTSGVIHIEAPHKIFPTIGDVFKVWESTKANTSPVTDAGAVQVQQAVARHQPMKVFVNLKPYTGNPLNIKLYRHTLVTIEIGPPYSRPQKYNFGAL